MSCGRKIVLCLSTGKSLGEYDFNFFFSLWFIYMYFRIIYLIFLGQNASQNIKDPRITPVLVGKSYIPLVNKFGNPNIGNPGKVLQHVYFFQLNLQVGTHTVTIHSCSMYFFQNSYGLLQQGTHSM